jgi:hypothetical protein
MFQGPPVPMPANTLQKQSKNLSSLRKLEKIAKRRGMAMAQIEELFPLN